MSAREEILAHLRKKRRSEVERPLAWQSRRHFDDLVARFRTALTRVYGEVHVTPTLEAGLDVLDTLLREIEAQRVVVNQEEPLTQIVLEKRWPAVTWHRVGRTDGDLRAFCTTADLGLSSADAALAETGSLILTSGPGQSRLATLLPPIHLALVPAARLTSDLFTWQAQRDGPLPANLTFVSGPSKTADIEQTMSIGVHGPKRFIVVLYGNGRVASTQT